MRPSHHNSGLQGTRLVFFQVVKEVLLLGKKKKKLAQDKRQSESVARTLMILESDS